LSILRSSFGCFDSGLIDWFDSGFSFNCLCLEVVSAASGGPSEMPLETAAAAGETLWLAVVVYELGKLCGGSFLDSGWGASGTVAALWLSVPELLFATAVGGFCTAAAGKGPATSLSFTLASAAAAGKDDAEKDPVSSASARRAFSSASRRAVYSDNPMRFDFIAASEIATDNK